jgi:hypothetical protein
VSISRGKQQQVAAEGAVDARAGVLSRRSVLGGLGGLAAIPVLYRIGSASPAQAATAPQAGSGASGSASSGSVSSGSVSSGSVSTNGGGDLVRGAERRYNAPLLTPGTRVVLPAGIKVVAVEDYYRRPRLAAGGSVWPRMRAADGSMVDASIVPERGGATRIAMLSGFTAGWYELVHSGGRADRVTWDAREFPFLWFYGEFGATDDAPYRDVFYTLALAPFSRNPYSRTSV